MFLWDQRARNTPRACLHVHGSGAVSCLQLAGGERLVVAGTSGGEVGPWGSTCRPDAACKACTARGQSLATVWQSSPLGDRVSSTAVQLAGLRSFPSPANPRPLTCFLCLYFEFQVKVWDLRGGSAGTLRFGAAVHVHPLLDSVSLRLALAAVPGLADQSGIPPASVQWLQVRVGGVYGWGSRHRNVWSGMCWKQRGQPHATVMGPTFAGRPSG